LSRVILQIARRAANLVSEIVLAARRHAAAAFKCFPTNASGLTLPFPLIMNRMSPREATAEIRLNAHGGRRVVFGRSAWRLSPAGTPRPFDALRSADARSLQCLVIARAHRHLRCPR
jgi:hypothetical protein